MKKMKQMKKKGFGEGVEEREGKRWRASPLLLLQGVCESELSAMAFG